MTTDQIDFEMRKWLFGRPDQDNRFLREQNVPAFATWDAWEEASKEIAEFESRLRATLRNDPDPVVRSAAAFAMGRVRLPSSSAQLIDALARDEPLVASEAASVLGLLGLREAIEPLCDALSHSDPNVRGSAATALGTIGGHEAVECLKRMLNDPDAMVRTAVEDGLRRSSEERK